MKVICQRCGCHSRRVVLGLAALCLVLALLIACASTEPSEVGVTKQVAPKIEPVETPNSGGVTGLPSPYDADNDGIGDSIEDKLAKRFAPVVRLHPDDAYRPADIPWYLTRVRMCFDIRWWFDRIILKPGQVDLPCLTSQSCLGQLSTLGATLTSFVLEHTDRYGGDRLDSYRKQTRQGSKPSDWVCYTHVSPAPAKDHLGMYDVQYIFFFGYNGDICWGPIESGHEADFEHITVRVEDDRETIHGIYYSTHEGEGKWYAPETSPGSSNGYAVTTGGHPIVYSALNSHACYPWAGEWNRLRNFNDFTADGGPEWDCQANIVSLGEKQNPRDGMQWIQYSGRWGEIGEVGFTTSPYGPAYQDWWNEEVPEGVAPRATSALSLNSGGIVVAVIIGMTLVGALTFAFYRFARRAKRP